MREGSSHNQLPISTMDKTPLVNNETWNKPNFENLWKSQCIQAIESCILVEHLAMGTLEKKTLKQICSNAM
jgi:hypothetical protein